MHHARRLATHLCQVLVKLGIEGLALKRQHDLGDIGGLVGDTLHVAHHLERGGHAAKVARHRLLRQKQFQAQGLDLALLVIDIVVALHDGTGALLVARLQHLHGAHDRLLHRRGHNQHLGLQQRELGIKNSTHHMT